MSYAPVRRAKAKYYLGIYPQYNFDYVDKEPCRAPLSTSSIKGITYYPKMGYGFWLAFVGETITTASMKCPNPVNNWGDGTGYSGTGTTTHTYVAPGLYWARITDGGAGNNAVRPVRVIYRERPTGVTYGPFDVNYPVWIDGTAEASQDTSVTVPISVRVDGRTATNTFGQLSDRTGVAIFVEDYHDGGFYGLKLVVGGFLSNPEKTMYSTHSDFTYQLKGLLNWLNQSSAQMREQQYVSPEMMSLIMANDAAAAQSVGAILSTDYLAQGYVPNHWLQADCVVIALHILQHLRVWTYAPYANPNMYWPQDTLDYGAISQFFDLITDDDFVEATGLPGSKFQDFPVSANTVLSNVRSLLTNEGWLFYDRADTSMRMVRSPYYKTTYPTAVETLDDLYKAGDQLKVAANDQIMVREIIVERPPDGLAMIAVTDAPGISTPYDNAGGGTRDAYDPNDCNSTVTTPPGITEHNKALAVYGPNSPLLDTIASSGTGGTNPLTDVNPNTFLYKYPNVEEGDTPRTSGLTITIKGIYSLSLRAIAIGKDKETRARWYITFALLQNFTLDNGDYVLVTHTTGQPWNQTWTAKRFVVASVTMTLSPEGQHVRQLTITEASPDE